MIRPHLSRRTCVSRPSQLTRVKYSVSRQNSLLRVKTACCTSKQPAARQSGLLRVNPVCCASFRSAARLSGLLRVKCASSSRHETASLFHETLGENISLLERTSVAKLT